VGLSPLGLVVDDVHPPEESPTADKAWFALPSVIPTTLGTATRSRTSRRWAPCSFRMTMVVVVGGSGAVVVVVGSVSTVPVSGTLLPLPTAKDATRPRIATETAMPRTIRVRRTDHHCALSRASSALGRVTSQRRRTRRHQWIRARTTGCRHPIERNQNHCRALHVISLTSSEVADRDCPETQSRPRQHTVSRVTSRNVQRMIDTVPGNCRLSCSSWADCR
jgi:hypothetical protein